MFTNYQHQIWVYECQKLIQERKIAKMKKKRILAALFLNEVGVFKRNYTKKRYWIHPLFKLRDVHGFIEAIFPTLLSFPEKFENYFRMNVEQFEELLGLVVPLISKQNTVRNSISAIARLAMTLRYLATGDCMTSVSYHYLVGFTTTINIINETCEMLWKCLNEKVLQYPLTARDWLEISHDFNEKWQFPHCMGAMDGKHIRTQCPDNAGSAYYNYKNHHSVVLMAICNADYSFVCVDIGAYGRQSDGGIFKNSAFGQKFEHQQMNVPQPDLLTVNGAPLPYVLVGDEAFQLSTYLLRPYPGRGGLTEERNIFNYRLSRARRTIENTFGIIVSKWRILKKPIEATVENTITTVQAIVVLHNWLRKHEKNDTYISDDDDINELRNEINDSALEDARVYGNHHSSKVAVSIRDKFCDYFNTEGAVPWQYGRTQ
ncbi:protein ALP1-like [Cotesia glomerata]|uniref:protein ALP1-like n=1 Tax=Cotesia glomerata TaxID=32391 RepID=UPI001D004329|nr:protein ALP1-like [Cotesia glomerata]